MAAKPKDIPWEVRWGQWGRLIHLKHGKFTVCVQQWVGREKVNWRIVADGQCWNYKIAALEPYRMLMGQGEQSSNALAMEKSLEVLDHLVKDTD